jgi:hypothetical protein
MNNLIGLSVLGYFLVGSVVWCQQWMGYHTSNYAGIHGVHFNPASLAGSNYKLDVNLVAANVHVANNFLGVSVETLFDQEAWSDPNFTRNYLRPDFTRDFYDAIAHVNVQLPAFMVALSPRDAIGFSPRVRTFLNVDHLDRQMVRFIWEEFDYPPQFNRRVDNPYFGAHVNLWAEYGLTYARTLIATKKYVFSGGLTVKLLQGLGGAYATARNYGYTVHNTDTMSFHQVDLRMGYSNSFANNRFGFQFEADPAVGFDVGFVFEYTPGKYDKWGMVQKSKYLRRTGIWADDESVYRAKIGVSLNDIGSMNYTRAPGSNHYILNQDSLDLSAFNGINGVQGFNDRLNAIFTPNGPNSNTFRMELPMHLQAYADFRFKNNFGFHMGTTISLQSGQGDDHRNHFPFQVNFVGRWEKKWFGVYVPAYFDSYGLIHMGLSLRAGPLVIGSGDILSSLIQTKYPSANVHVALRWIFPVLNQSDIPSTTRCPAYGRGQSGKKRKAPKKKRWTKRTYI